MREMLLQTGPALHDHVHIATWPRNQLELSEMAFLRKDSNFYEALALDGFKFLNFPRMSLFQPRGQWRRKISRGTERKLAAGDLRVGDHFSVNSLDVGCQAALGKFLMAYPVVAIVEVKRERFFNDRAVCQTIGYHIASCIAHTSACTAKLPPLAVLICGSRLRLLFFPFLSGTGAECSLHTSKRLSKIS